MPAGVTGYAAINARVRVMYSTLLSPQALNELCEVADWDSLVSALKATAYGPYLEQVKDRSINPRRVVFQLKMRLSETYGAVIRGAPEHARPILSTLFDHFEVDNLKAVLRGIVAGATWDRIRFVLFPLGTSSNLPAQEMVESGSVTAAVEMLRGTHYYETLSYAMKRYSLEQSLFPLEVALDLSHWRKLWASVNRLTGDDRTFAIRIIGSLVDLNNMMWAVRYRTFHHLSEEELINYTLPFGHHVHDEDIRLIAAGADIPQVVSRIWPRINDVAEILRDPRHGLSELELEFQRHLANECRAAFVGNPFQIGIPLGYLVLSELEIQDLTVLVEAKANGTPLAEFKPFLVLSGEPA
jgi:V/A-type H+/Na+-transporting ATPase subunit C